VYDAKGDYPRALATLQDGIAAGESDCHAALGAIRAQRGDRRSAITAWEKGVANDDPESAYHLGAALCESRRASDRSRGAVLLARAGHRGVCCAWNFLGVMAVDRGADPLPDLRRAWREGCLYGAFNTGVALCQHSQTAPEEAIDAFRYAARNGMVDAARNLALLSMEQGRAEIADVLTYRAADGDYDAASVIAEVYERLGQRAEAQAALAAVDPDTPELLEANGRAALSRGDVATARSCFEKAYAAGAHSALMGLAGVEETSGRTERMLDLLENAAAANVPGAAVWLAALVRPGDHRYASSAAVLRRADRNGDALAARALGVRLLDVGQPTQAIRPLDRSIERAPDDPITFVIRGCAHLITEDKQAAERDFVAADRLGHAGAATQLGYLREDRGDRAGAKRAYARAARRGDRDGAAALAHLMLADDAVPLSAVRAALERAAALGASCAITHLIDERYVWQRAAGQRPARLPWLWLRERRRVRRAAA
jgi:tetratricopeptide (TPR) repeat protein